MFITINNANHLRDQFRDMGRQDQFSHEALGLLYGYIEDVNPDYELDVIAICCEYSEASIESIVADYSIDIDIDGICTASAYGLERVKQVTKDAVMDYLQDNTSVVGVTSTGSIVYAQF